MRSEKAMVAADHAEASRTGVEILRKGGNAVDAACAVSFALAVTRPESTGLGGGGFMIVRLADTGRAEALDYREVAPLGARPEMYERSRARVVDDVDVVDAPAARGEAEGQAGTPKEGVPDTGKMPVPQELSTRPAPQDTGEAAVPLSRFGHLAVAVPGQVSGLADASRRWGVLPWAELVAPAIRLAEEGFAVDEHYVAATRVALSRYEEYPALRASCPYVWQVHLNGGKLRRPGDLLRQPALAKLLRTLAKDGPDAFYRGPVAEAIEAEMKRGGGLIGKADLAAYRPVYREPVSGTYRGYTIVSMPPPSSGGVCLIEALNILETQDMPALWASDEGVAVHYMIEAMKHAFADRARWMADADFVPVPVDLLTSKTYAQQLARGLDPNTTSPSDMYGALQIPPDAGTSHFCIVDEAGNCVVSTETINTVFGSLAAVSDWGLILNNEMDDFTAVTGRANQFGLIQSDRNAPSAGKRPLSSMSPTIVLRGEQPVLLVGASGGPRIISSVLDVICDVLDRGQPIGEAMTALRVHHQWQPDKVVFDRDPPEELAAALRAKGHRIAQKDETGAVQAIYRTKEGLVGVCELGKGGKPAGY